MPNQEIEEFAKKLVIHVRDAAIQSCDQQLQQRTTSPIAKRWRDAATQEIGPSPNVMIPDCVDETIFHLLQAVDQGLLPLFFSSTSGKIINLTEEGFGELAGWYMASGGWRGMYSSERFFDDFSNLDSSQQ